VNYGNLSYCDSGLIGKGKGYFVPSADELRGKIEKSHSGLRTVLEQVDAAKWELVPVDDDQWHARETAEHVIGAARRIAGRVADAMMGKAPEAVELSLATPAEAINALELAIEDVNKVIRYVEDRDLEKNVGDDATIESRLELLAVHADVHSEQIISSTS
tara:strand:- start:1134 stop:1613 length:480 start_codon:yes stop_codon:yes gene_type:complete